MSAGDGKPKPKSPLVPAPKPVAASARPAVQPRGASDSSFDLAPVGGTSSRSLPRVPTNAGAVPAKNPFQNEKTTQGGPSLNIKRPPSSSSSQSLAPVPSASAQGLPAVGPTPGLVAPPRRKTNIFRKRLESSAFDEEEHTQLDAVLGNAKRLDLDVDEVLTNTSEFYDGETPAKECTDKESWRAVEAPVQSRPRRRAARLLWVLIDQFAVSNNPRYRVSSAMAEPKAHVFAWDVSRAMGCEIPHNRGGREMTLSQTVDWVRSECEFRGWKRLEAPAALAAADRGELVLVVSRDRTSRALGVVRPGGPGDDGKARVATAGRFSGNDLGLAEAIGPAVEFFGHA